MVQTILLELLYGIGRFFINPLLYVAIIFSVILGHRRVKRERRFFHIRIEEGWQELKSLWRVGFIASILLSIVSVAVGLTVPVVYLIALIVLTIIFLCVFHFHLLSPIIVGAMSFGALLYLHAENQMIEVFGYQLKGLQIDTEAVTTVTIIIGLLLLMEGLLIKKDGAKFASPIVEKTKRGLKSIAYYSKKIWVVPMFFIIPGNSVQELFTWWPVFTLGSEQFSLVLFPIVIGFQQLTRRLLPKVFYPKLGNTVQVLGVLVVLGGIGSYFTIYAAYITLALAIIGRLLISIISASLEQKDYYAVSPSNKGAVIAAVLPNSPAEKMGLTIGEVIKRVNGQDVYTEKELYEALQINAAHCRLEVLDTKGEIRLTQYVVHNDDHHQIGLLLVQ